MALPTNAVVVLTPFQDRVVDDPDFGRAYYFSCLLIPDVNHRLQHLVFGNGTVGQWEDYGINVSGVDVWTAGAPFVRQPDGTYALLEIFRIVADIEI